MILSSLGSQHARLWALCYPSKHITYPLQALSLTKFLKSQKVFYKSLQDCWFLYNSMEGDFAMGRVSLQ